MGVPRTSQAAGAMRPQEIGLVVYPDGDLAAPLEVGHRADGGHALDNHV